MSVDKLKEIGWKNIQFESYEGESCFHFSLKLGRRIGALSLRHSLITPSLFSLLAPPYLFSILSLPALDFVQACPTPSATRSRTISRSGSERSCLPSSS